MTVTGVDMNRDGSRRVARASGWLQRSCVVWGACGNRSHFPRSRIVPAVCLVETVLSWMISPSAFSLVWLVNPWLSLCGHTIPSKLPCLRAVCRVCENVQESSNCDSKLAVVYTDFLQISMFQHVELRSSRCVSPAHLVLVECYFNSPTQSSFSVARNVRQVALRLSIPA